MNMTFPERNLVYDIDWCFSTSSGEHKLVGFYVLVVLLGGFKTLTA